jgi:GTP cyclohydrolase I
MDIIQSLNAIKLVIRSMGDDPNREGLADTPSRVLASYQELFSGYEDDPVSVMRIFEDGACDEMVVLKGAEIYSTCEHHLLPFFGIAHIAYLPKGRVIGISKLARLLEIYARRLQIQERLTQQITAALDEHLQPLGSACVIEAKHLCMIARGVQKQHSTMITSSLTGEFRDDKAVRQEFFNLIRS